MMSSTENYSAALTQHLIGKPASKERGQVNEPCIETINLRCERLHAKWTEQVFERTAHFAECVR